MIIVDEVSTVSSLNLAYMHLRLELDMTGLVEGMCYLLGTCFSCSQSKAVSLKHFPKSPCVLNWAVRRLSISGQIQ